MLRQMLTQIASCAKPLGITLTLVTLLVFSMGNAAASPIPVVNANLPCSISGSGCLNGNTSAQVIANVCINFYSTNSPDTCTSTLLASDTYTEGSSDQSVFAGSTAPPTVGTIKDVQFNVGPVLSFITAPGPLGTVTFDALNAINPVPPACPGSGSPTNCSAGFFTLTQNSPSQVTVSIGFNANGCLNGSTATGCTASGGSTPYLIDFSSQFNNETILDLIGKSGTPPNFIFNSISFTANPVPEPAGFLLVGAGLLALGLISRRWSRS